MKRIVLTGGHAGTTALSIIEELAKTNGKWDIYWIGPERAFPGDKVLSLEAKLFPELGVSFHPIIAGKLQRRWSIHTIPGLVKIPFGFVHAFLILRKIKPDVVLSFGGYSAFPVVLISWLLGIPAVLQEQITGLGLANRLSVPFAKKVALARIEGRKYVSAKKAIVTGNPMRKSIRDITPKLEIGEPPTLYITGGSRGSQIINKIIDFTLEELLEKYNIIHLTGELDYEYFKLKSEKLNRKYKNKYEVASFIRPKVVAKNFRRADIIISRSGANAVSEIIHTARPSILIPFPWTMYQEQVKNAHLARKAGIAKVINQDDFTPKKLLKTVSEVRKDWNKMVRQHDNTLAKQDFRAHQKIVEIVEELA